MITGIVAVFVLVAVEITLKYFSLIHRLPDFILRWIGGSMDNAIDAADMRARSESAMAAGAEAVKRGLGHEGTKGRAPGVKRLGPKKDTQEPPG